MLPCNAPSPEDDELDGAAVAVVTFAAANRFT
jgi:hypothetical protein